MHNDIILNYSNAETETKGWKMWEKILIIDRSIDFTSKHVWYFIPTSLLSNPQSFSFIEVQSVLHFLRGLSLSTKRNKRTGLDISSWNLPLQMLCSKANIVGLNADLLKESSLTQTTATQIWRTCFRFSVIFCAKPWPFWRRHHFGFSRKTTNPAVCFVDKNGIVFMWRKWRKFFSSLWTNQISGKTKM